MASKTLPFIAVLSHRQFLYLWLSQIFSQFAANITLFLLGLIVYRNTGSNAAVSGLFMAYGIPSILFGLLAGTAVDYIDKRMIILYSCIIRAVLVLGLLLSSHFVAFVYVLLFLNAVDRIYSCRSSFEIFRAIHLPPFFVLSLCPFLVDISLSSGIIG